MVAAALWPGIQGTGVGIRRSTFCSHLYLSWPWAKQQQLRLSFLWGIVPCLTRTLLERFAVRLGKKRQRIKNSLHHHQAAELVSSLPATRIIGIFQEKILPAACGKPWDEWEFFLSLWNCRRGANKATLLSFGVSYTKEILVISVESWAGSAQRSTGCSFVCHIMVSTGQLMHPSSLESSSCD